MFGIGEKLLQWAIENWIITGAGASFLIGYITKKIPDEKIDSWMPYKSVGKLMYGIGVAQSAILRKKFGPKFAEKVEDFLLHTIDVLAACMAKLYKIARQRYADGANADDKKKDT